MRKLFKFNKEKVKAFCFGTLLAGIVFTSSNIYAAEYEANFSKDYLDWKNGEASEFTMPRTYSVGMSEDYLKNNTLGTLSSTLIDIDNDNILKLNEVKASYTDSRYSLADNYDIRIKNQKTTNECWAFSLLSSMETSNLMTKGKTENFSERHMDYYTAKTFTDGINDKAYAREVGDGGLTPMGLAYLTNGSGAVLESDLPFEDNENKISISELNKPVNEIVTSYEALPTIYKILDSEGNLRYVNDQGNEIDSEGLTTIRNYIKSTIINKGAITAVTCGGVRDYYEKPEDPLSSKNYFCDKYDVIRDHAITIVGWDDNYSKENFNANHRPKSDGAYIVLNSYGEENFDHGFIYISYEDALIETDLYVVSGTKKPDYDKIYQTDFFGGMFSIGSKGMTSGYYANVFDRDATKEETLESVGVTLDDYAKVEIYVNPNGDTLTSGNLVLVGSSGKVLAPGYQEIKIKSTPLKGNKYAIVIKQFSETNTFSVSIETSYQNSIYSNVKSSNCGYISEDGVEWEKVNNLDIIGLEMENADVCIKGFTKITGDAVEEKFSSPVYRIDLEKIFKIEYDTSKDAFMKNIDTNMNYQILTEDGKDVTTAEEEPIIRTGMKLKLENGKEYLLVVRGDINCDGKITLTDLSKLILEYNEVSGFRLAGAQLDGGDLNCDGNITLTDISQLIVIYSKI